MKSPERRRRTTTNIASSKRVPLPVSIELHNLFLHSFPHSKTTKWFVRPEHSTTLLHQVRLQIVVVNDNGDGGDRRRVLYDAIDTSKSIRPCWQHLNEDMAMDALQDLTVEDYESMKACFFLVANDDDDSEAQTQQQQQNNNNNDTPFLEAPIYPSKLSKIDQQQQVPSNLPLNALIVKFTDESVRVPPALYRLLVEHKQIFVVKQQQQQQQQMTATTATTSRARSPQRTTAHRHGADTSRFDDDVFSTLDQVTPVKNNNSSSFEEAATTRGPTLASTQEEDDFNHKLTESIVAHQDLLQEQKLLEQLLQEEEAALQQQESQLQQQQQQQQEKDKLLQHILQQVQTKDRQTLKVLAATQTERRAHGKTAFLLEAQRIRLFRELQTIYPITTTTTTQSSSSSSPEQRYRYRIRGLEVPSNDLLFSYSAVPEEELSASMGYLCHLVTMMSKYMAVQLRYPIKCHVSRSTIQDDRGIVFPLYYGITRNVYFERDQFEHGVRLLGRNVDCLCKERNIRVSPKLHILAKVKRVYESVIDGY